MNDVELTILEILGQVDAAMRSQCPVELDRMCCFLVACLREPYIQRAKPGSLARLAEGLAMLQGHRRGLWDAASREGVK